MRHHFSRRQLLATLGGLPLAAAPRSERPPNIVAILADDQGWGDLSVHGNTNLATPHIDSLARAGALFERFYVCSVCAPTRAEFLTGRYHPRCGVRGVSTGAERMNLDETTVADTFRSAGYATGAFGKWHNGSQHPYHPNARGFDEYYGFTSGHWGHYFDPPLDHNGRPVRGQGYITDDLTTRAMGFIERHRARPFFCYLPYNTPHSPMQVPDGFYRKFAGLQPRLRHRDPAREDLLMTRAALAMCENIDWNVGRVLARLRELDLERETIVLYFSDNGPNSWRWNGGMKGRKGSLDEGGLRVPFLIRWPGRIRGGSRVTRIAGAVDLLPTLADMAGVSLVSRKPLDGKSLRPLLEGGSERDWPGRMLFSASPRGTVSVVTQQYRLDSQGQLFDLTSDPGQQRDIAAEKPEVAARLREAAARWAKEALPQSPDGRPFTVGYAPYTVLPARDGVPAGGIERSSPHPNCSFFRHWTTTEDRIAWDIEVGESAEYEAEIHYTCPAADTGATVELSFGNARVTGKIAPAHDPPLVGAEADRVKRIESFVKDFRPLRLGVIRLAKGRGKLTLRALDIPGTQVADIRSVALTRPA